MAQTVTQSQYETLISRDPKDITPYQLSLINKYRQEQGDKRLEIRRDERSDEQVLTYRRSGINVVGDAPSYKSEGQILQERKQAYEQERAEQIANARIQTGQGTVRDVFAGQQVVPLTRQNIQALRERAEYSEQRRREVSQSRTGTGSAYERAAYTLQGAEPVATSITGEYIYNVEGSQFVSRDVEIGSNVNKTVFDQYTPPKVKKSSGFFLFPGQERLKTGIKQYAAGVSSQIYAVTEERDFDYRGKVNVTEYRTNSRRIDINLIASLKSIGSTYTDVQKGIVQTDPIVSTAQKGATTGLYFAVAGGDVLTRKIPYVRTAYGSAASVSLEFGEQAIKDPVLTYAAVRAPKVLGSKAYAFLDYADVTQSVVTEGAKGYIAGGIPGAVAGGVGGYAGERVSDRFAFFTADVTPQIPTFSFKYSGKYQDFVARPVKQDVQPQYLVDVITPDKLSVTQLAPYTQDFDVLLQYQPKVRRGKEIIQNVQNEEFLQRYKLLTRAPETEDADFVYTATEPVLPQFVFTSTKRLTPVIYTRPRELKTQWGKRASAQFTQSLYSEPSIRLPQSPIQQVTGGTLTQSIVSTPTLKLMSVITPKTLNRYYTPQARRQDYRPVNLQRPSTPSLQLFKPLTLTRSDTASLTRTPSATITRNLTRSLSRTQTFLQTPSLTRTPTRTPSVTITPTITKTRTPTWTPIKTPNINALFGNYPKGRKMPKRYTQSIGALFIKMPKGFSRASISAKSGIGVRF